MLVVLNTYETRLVEVLLVAAGGGPLMRPRYPDVAPAIYVFGEERLSSAEPRTTGGGAGYKAPPPPGREAP